MRYTHSALHRTRLCLYGWLLLLLTVTMTARADEVPPKPVRIPAEFEPMQTVIVDGEMVRDWDFYKYLAQDVHVIMLCPSNLYAATQTKLAEYGVNMDNFEFCLDLFTIPRDFLPWFAFVNRNEPAFVWYNGTTPEFLLAYGYPIYTGSPSQQGGDFMTDGQGTGVSFDWVAQHGMLNDEYLTQVWDYWGIHTYHLIANPPITGVTVPPHIDCQAKYLSPDTVLVVRYPSSNGLYEQTEASAAYFHKQISYYGTPYKVLRLDVPSASSPYINSLILNHRVFVPMRDSIADADALAAYQAAMPGYEVIGVSGTWYPFWSLHCCTMNIADEQMLYINHIPLLGRPSAAEGFPVRAEIEAFSGTEFVDGTPIVHWTTVTDVNESTASWDSVAMVPDPNFGDHQYLAYLPAQPVGTTIQYYIEAKDASGRDEMHPYIGQAQAHTFTVTTLGANVSAVSAQRGGTVEFYINMTANYAQQPYRLAYSIAADPNGADVTLPETTVLTGFEGTLDDLGIASAQLTFPEALASEWVDRSLCFWLEPADQADPVGQTVTIEILE